MPGGYDATRRPSSSGGMMRSSSVRTSDCTLGRMATDRRRTKIVATIGPVTSTHDAVRDLVEAGVDAIRLNLSHGIHADHEARARVVREVQSEMGKPLALIADLQGPKLRIGDLDL